MKGLFGPMDLLAQIRREYTQYLPGFSATRPFPTRCWTPALGPE